MSRRGERLLFAGGVAALWGFFVAMAWLTPVTLDDWYAVDWHQQHDLGLGEVLDFARYNYFNYNPRPGDTWLLLVNGPPLLHLLLTPLMQMLLLLVVHALAFARRPRADLGGLAELVLVQALIWLAIPTPGPIYFYRPFTTNYLFGSCFQLLLFVQFRLALSRPGDGADAAGSGSRWRRSWPALPIGAWAVLAGMTNEHTGPSAIVMALALTIFAWRSGRARAWMVAATLGLAAGYALLYFAPGHTVRYAGLSADISPLATLRSRGLIDCMRIVGAVLAEAQAALLLVVLAGLAARLRGGDAVRAALDRPTVATMVAATAGAAMITVTTFASPIVEDRVLLASCLLIVVALAAACRAIWREPRARAALVAVATAVVVGHAVIFLVIYRELHAESRARLAALAAAGPDEVVSFRPGRWPYRDRWVYGEDLLYAYMREFVAHRVYDVGGIELEPLPALAQPTPPERMIASVEHEPPIDARAARPDWPLWRFVPSQWAWVVREIRETQHQLELPGHRLRGIDVTVDPQTSGLVTDRPIYLVRWRDGRFSRVDAKAYTGRLGYTWLNLSDPHLPLSPTEAWLSACGVTRPVELRVDEEALLVRAQLYCSGNHTVYVCDAAACWLAGRYW